MTYLKEPMFWLAVVAVAVVVNYVWKAIGKKGKLV
jgi:hypothetical protein